MANISSSDSKAAELSTVKTPSSSRIQRSFSSPSSKAAVTNAASSFLLKVRRGAHVIQSHSPIHSQTHSRRASDSSQASDKSSGEEKDEKNKNSSKPEILTPTKKKAHTRTTSATWTCSSGPPGSAQTQTSVDLKMKRVEYKDTFICTGGVNLPLLLRATKGTLWEVLESQAGIRTASGSATNLKIVLDPDREKWTCTISGPPPSISISHAVSTSQPSSPTSPSFPAAVVTPPASPTSSSPPKTRRRDSSSASASYASLGSKKKYKVHIRYIAYAAVVPITSTSTTSSSGSTTATADYHQPVALDHAKEGSVRGLMTIISRRDGVP